MEPPPEDLKWTRLGPTHEVAGDVHAVICSYCMRPVEFADPQLLTVSVTEGHNPKPRPDRTFFGHVTCLIESLHPDLRDSWSGGAGARPNIA
jgi:hypothetical protein